MAVGFLIGMALCLLLFTVNDTPQVRAEESHVTLSGVPARDSLLPDIGKIYRTALGSPYRQVESDIKDPDIARDYRDLLDSTGLENMGAE